MCQLWPSIYIYIQFAVREDMKYWFCKFEVNSSITLACQCILRYLMLYYVWLVVSLWDCGLNLYTCCLWSSKLCKSTVGRPKFLPWLTFILDCLKSLCTYSHTPSVLSSGFKICFNRLTKPMPSDLNEWQCTLILSGRSRGLRLEDL